MQPTLVASRERILQEFKADPDFLRGYVDNVACLLMDRIPGFKQNKTKRDELALDIIYRIFE